MRAAGKTINIKRVGLTFLMLQLILISAAPITAQEGGNDYTSMFYFDNQSGLHPSLDAVPISSLTCPDILNIGGASGVLGVWSTPAPLINLSIGGECRVSLLVEGTGIDLSFDASVKAGDVDLGSASSLPVTINGERIRVELLINLKDTVLEMNKALHVQLGLSARKTYGLQIIMGDKTNPSMISLKNGGVQSSISIKSQDDWLRVECDVVHPWGSSQLTSAAASLSEGDSREPAKTEPVDGGVYYLWGFEGVPEGEHTIELKFWDLDGNTYIIQEQFASSGGGGLMIQGGIGYLFAVLGAVMVAGYLGGMAPLLPYWTDKQMRYLLAFSAGIFISVALFHAIPEAMEMAGMLAAAAILIGFGAIYSIEHLFINVIDKHFNRLLPMGHEHSHEGRRLHLHEHHAKEHQITHAGDVDGDDIACSHHLHTSAEVAFVGVSFHNLIEGIVITALFVSPETRAIGLLVILAVVLHKAPCTLSISSLLKMGGYPDSTVRRGIFILLAMTPLGAMLALSLLVGVSELAIGLALGISAGTFLEIGVMDLIPEALEEKEGRNLAVIAMALGLLLLWVFSLAE